MAHPRDMQVPQSEVLDWTFRGCLGTSGGVEVPEHQFIEAQIHARSVVVLGTLKGNVRAVERVHIGSSGRLGGIVQTPRMSVAPGGNLDGLWMLTSPGSPGEESFSTTTAPPEMENVSNQEFQNLAASGPADPDTPPAFDYCRSFHLKFDPFRDSPSPRLFFPSSRHEEGLQRLGSALRGKAGVTVLAGEPGTGKSILCREFLRRHAPDRDKTLCLLSDNRFQDPGEFLRTALGMMGNALGVARLPEPELEEALKDSILERTRPEDKALVWILDNAASLPADCLDILSRVSGRLWEENCPLFLILVSQQDADSLLGHRPTLKGRLKGTETLGPMSFGDVRALIRFRLKQAQGEGKPLPVFTWPSQYVIYKTARGVPRRVLRLCHWILLTLTSGNRSRAGLRLARTCSRMVFPG